VHVLEELEKNKTLASTYCLNLIISKKEKNRNLSKYGDFGLLGEPSTPNGFSLSDGEFRFFKIAPKKKKAVSWVLKLRNFEFLYKFFLPDVGNIVPEGSQKYRRMLLFFKHSCF
jgi:hypothetical protein